MSAAPVPARVDEFGEHPWWCSPAHCTAGEPLGDHRSVPQVVPAPSVLPGLVSVEVSLWLDAYTGLTDAAGIELKVSRAVGGGSSRVVSLDCFELTAQQLRQLAAACLAIADLHERHSGHARVLDTAGGR